MRLAFGTFFGLPDPMKMFGDSDIAHTRFRAAPDSALAAEADTKLVGSNFVTNWRVSAPLTGTGAGYRGASNRNT
jgi:hypothetical protein